MPADEKPLNEVEMALAKAIAAAIVRQIRAGPKYKESVPAGGKATDRGAA